MSKPSVKTIGQSGQLSLGKEYAGQTVVVDSPEAGVWVIKTAKVIPENEMWLHQEPYKSDLEAALRWAAEHPATETDVDELEERVMNHLVEREHQTRSE